MTTKTRRLHEVIAVQKGVRQRNTQETDNLHKMLQKSDLFNGMTRKFQPLDDESNEKYPDENKKVQTTVAAVLESMANYTAEIVNLEATNDKTNTLASADIILPDGTEIAKDVPVATLLDLEKVLNDWRTTIKNLPTLDPAEDWERVEGSPLMKNTPTKTHKTAKVEEPLLLAPATKEHPAQVKTTTRDVVTGHWTTTKYSGAISADEKNALHRRANLLLDAVKQARERANNAEVVEVKIGESVFNYLLGR